MIEYFSGNSLDSRWNQTNNSGTGGALGYGMIQVGGGLKITSGSSFGSRDGYELIYRHQMQIFTITGPVAIIIAKAPVTD